MLVHNHQSLRPAYYPSTETLLSGIIGKPLDHTLSPSMHMTAFRETGIDALFIPFAIEEYEIECVLKAMTAMRFIGLSVTMPYKKAVIPFLDALDESASFCQAVNVIAIKGKQLIGYNTDGLGFVQGMVEQSHYEPQNKNFLLLGSGGSARAIAFALAKTGAKHIDILNRAPRERNAHALAVDINTYRNALCTGWCLNNDTMRKLLKQTDCIINTTPASMEHIEEKTAFDLNLLEPRHMVCDIVYKPKITPMLHHAQQIGCRTLEGKWMLIYQGVLAWCYWTNSDDAPVSQMAEAVENYL